MARFLALTSIGLADVLEAELQALGHTWTRKIPGGVEFEGNWASCYKANLCLRTATRIVLPILDFPAYQNSDIYHNVRKHDFTKYIFPSQTIQVESAVRDSQWRDQRYVSLNVKDAIVDQFRDKFKSRPSVDRENADLRILVRVVKDQFSLAIDTSGENLTKRGYRMEGGSAPLREHFAAGLVGLSGWTIKQPLVDVMCGSGTILIEAATKALNWSPQRLRRRFAFQGFQNFQSDAWERVKKEVAGQENVDVKLDIVGYDEDAAQIARARRNALRAGVSDYIRFEVAELRQVRNSLLSKGVLITNPPYGLRLEDEGDLGSTYSRLGDTLRREFRDWDCYVLSGNPELTTHLRLKSTNKQKLFNGSIECRFLRYPISSEREGLTNQESKSHKDLPKKRLIRPKKD